MDAVDLENVEAAKAIAIVAIRSEWQDMEFPFGSDRFLEQVCMAEQIMAEALGLVGEGDV